MKPILLVLLFASLGATGLSFAQKHIEITNNNGHTTISVHCDDTPAVCARLLKKLPQPPAPPAPPTPPQPPEIGNLPELPELAELPDLPDPPPPPPEPVVPKQVHQACQGKAEGEAAHWRSGDQAYYAGTCKRHQGTMQLDVNHIELSELTSLKTRP